MSDRIDVSEFEQRVAAGESLAEWESAVLAAFVELALAASDATTRASRPDGHTTSASSSHRSDSSQTGSSLIGGARAA